jgi:hypothetical protein
VISSTFSEVTDENRERVVCEQPLFIADKQIGLTLVDPIKGKVRRWNVLGVKFLIVAGSHPRPYFNDYGTMLTLTLVSSYVSQVIIN